MYRHVHLQLCLISRKLNVLFKVQMLIQMIWYFSEAISLCLSLYQLFGNYQGEWTFYSTVVQLYVYFSF